MAKIKVTEQDIETFRRDGVVLIKSLFSDYIDKLRKGIEKNILEPSEYGAENLQEGETGRFFDDYCNWQRIPEFKDVIFHSPVGEVASRLMQSKTVQLFHDHILVKEPGTSKATPWHQDSPYYFVDGTQTISFWSPIDKVNSASLRCVAGSHRWEKSIMPKRWLNNEDFYTSSSSFSPIPDPDKENLTIKEWIMEPGDAVAFDFKTLHGARGNKTRRRRRAFSLRLVGDDARYVERPGKTSPPFPGHKMIEGQILRPDWFPIIYTRTF